MRAARRDGRGGCVMDLRVHLVDLALWVLNFSQVAEVSSTLFADASSNHVEDYSESLKAASRSSI